MASFCQHLISRGVTNLICKYFIKGYKTITQAIYKNNPPEPSEYIASGASRFGNSFFIALAEFCKNETGSEHFIHSVLGVSLADAKALSVEILK